MDDSLLLLLVCIVVAVLIFLVCRELNCWYLKINERNRLLRTMIDNQEKIIDLLSKQDDDKSSEEIKQPE